MKRVIVIGLDGLEPTIVETMFKQGELTHLKSIARAGDYTRVKTTYPAQTPVAWSTFATGRNPGGHGIYDFISRDPQTYSISVALNRFEQKNAFVPPRAVNSRKGPAVWDLLSASGIPSTIVRCPCTFPPEEINGRILAGVGVPDLRGGFGTPTFYSSRTNVERGESERVERVSVDSNGRVRTHLTGPRNPKDRSNLVVGLELIPDPARQKLTIRSDGQPRELEIRVGEWSDWLRLKFKAGLLSSIRGIVRFYVSSLEPEIALYASPINFDPAAPMFPLSYPPEYAAELESEIGTFYTTGMVEDHGGLNNGRLSEEAYLEQCRLALEEREAMMLYELSRMDEGFFFCLFDTPDRLQHMFWRFRESDHPANQGDGGRHFGRTIEDHYRACDQVVGRALEFMDDKTLIIVLSDHGMGSFKRGFHLNSWLHQNGLLSLKEGVRPGPDAGDFLSDVDWSATKAYGLGLGAIYLNLRDREGEGIVDAEQSNRLKTQIAQTLTGLKDPERGQVAIRSVSTREEIYKGPHIELAPDLMINFAPGYRVSWDTPLGGIAEGLFEDNQKKWSGDHVVDPAIVPGILLLNRPFHKEDVELVDLAPTIIDALGAKKSADMEGRSLL